MRWVSAAVAWIGLLSTPLPLLASAGPTPVIEFTARVEAAQAGDRLEVRWGRFVHPLRLAGVRCPPSDRPYGDEARLRTSELTVGKLVHVAVERRHEGRLIAWVTLPDGRLLNAELLRAGLAWRESGADEPRLVRAESEARSARRGLWRDPDSLPSESPLPLKPASPSPRAPRTPPPRVQSGSPDRPSSCTPRSQCCRVCSKGKACGNSCIRADFNCHKGRGCACNSWEVCR